MHAHCDWPIVDKHIVIIPIQSASFVHVVPSVFVAVHMTKFYNTVRETNCMLQRWQGVAYKQLVSQDNQLINQLIN